MILKTKQLKKVKYAEEINRLVLLLTILPVFHAAACLGQGAKVPMVDKISTACFAASAYTGYALNKKRKTLESKIQEAMDNKHYYC